MYVDLHKKNSSKVVFCLLQTFSLKLQKREGGEEEGRYKGKEVVRMGWREGYDVKEK